MVRKPLINATYGMIINLWKFQFVLKGRSVS